MARIEIIQETERDPETGRKLTAAVGRCVCGEEVPLGNFTCPCECGRDYGPDGDLLAPRSQWGEETGEVASDMLINMDGALDDY